MPRKRGEKESERRGKGKRGIVGGGCILCCLLAWMRPEIELAWAWDCPCCMPWAMLGIPCIPPLLLPHWGSECMPAYDALEYCDWD